MELPATEMYDLQTLENGVHREVGSAMEASKRVTVPPLELLCSDSRPLEELHVAIQVCCLSHIFFKRIMIEPNAHPRQLGRRAICIFAACLLLGSAASRLATIH